MASLTWSETEISKAKEYFLGGLDVKNIAKKLGRTPSATNKALTRFKIRTQPPKRSKPLPGFFCPTKQIIAKPIPRFDKKSLGKLLDNWVSFWKVCSYLETQKVCFYETSPHGVELSERTFLVDNTAYSASQLLLMANKIRVANNQSAFLVEGLSW